MVGRVRNLVLVTVTLTVSFAAAGGLERWPSAVTTTRPDYDSWPQVDSLTVDADYYVAGQDTARIFVWISNPHLTQTFDFPVQVQVRRDDLEYVYTSLPEPVSLTPGAQESVEFPWFDAAAVAGLEYDIAARLLFNEATKSNLFENGDFEAGLSSWTLVNDNPPGYGIEHTTYHDGDPDGEAHVYTTQYNTYGIQPQIFQQEANIESDGLVHLGFAMSTQDISYGVAYGIVYVKRGAGTTNFWRSNAAAPPDDDFNHFIRVFDSARHNRSITIDQIPNGSGTTVEVGAFTGLLSSSGYAFVEADIYLDDVGVTNTDPTYLENAASYILTDTDTQYIGDWQQALVDCYSDSDFPEGAQVLRSVPLISYVFVWDKVYQNACAGSVWHDLGRPLEKYLCLGRAALAVTEGPATVLGAAGLNVVSTGSTIGNGVLQLTLEAADAGLQEHLNGPVQTEGAWKEALPDAAIDATLNQAFIWGAGKLAILLSVPAKGAVAFARSDSTSLIDAWVYSPSPDFVTLAEVGPRVRQLQDVDPVPPSVPRILKWTATGDGPASFTVLNRRVDDVVDTLSVQDLALMTGNICELTVSDTTSQYWMYLDFHGDGHPDSVFIIEPSGGITNADLPAPPSTTFRVYPNPFNPATTISYELDLPTFVKLGVYDVAGRLVRRLEEGMREKGTHLVEWNGRDNSGRGRASGTYFLRFSDGARTVTKKVSLVR